jgi:hypothetical protein
MALAGTFSNEGVAGLARNKTRPAREPPLADAIKRAMLTKTASERPSPATHWSRASIARGRH